MNETAELRNRIEMLRSRIALLEDMTQGAITIIEQMYDELAVMLQIWDTVDNSQECWV